MGIDFYDSDASNLKRTSDGLILYNSQLYLNEEKDVLGSREQEFEDSQNIQLN